MRGRVNRPSTGVDRLGTGEYSSAMVTMQHSLPSDPEVVAIKRARRIIALREQGMSIKQIAAIEGVSDKRIYRIFEKIRRYQARGWM